MVASVLSEVVFKEGEFLGRLGEIGFENKARAGLEEADDAQAIQGLARGAFSDWLLGLDAHYGW